MYSSQKGFAHLLLLISLVGVIAFLLISNTFEFKEGLFSYLFPKPSSYASSSGETVPGEILFKFKPGVEESAKSKIINEHALQVLETIPGIDVLRIKVPDGARDKIIEALKKNPRVEYAEPSLLAQPLAIPNDPYWLNRQWNLQRIDAPRAYDLTNALSGGGATTVAVADSGIHLTHEDLASKIVTGRSFLDGNSSLQDEYGHGTIVSGLVGAVTNNGIGVASLGWNIKVMPLRIADASGNAGSGQMVSAITYAADQGIKVVNISYGGYSDTIPQYYQDAVDYAWNKGTIVVAAAGNSALSNVAYPAKIDKAIAVGSTDGADVKSNFSTYGQGLDVVAPGSGVFSTNLSGTYGGYFGTSYATPQVAALVGLINSAKPGLTPQQVTDILTSTTVDLGTSGWDEYYGYGRINAGAAVQKAIETSVSSDSTRPIVSITSPLNGASVEGLLNIAVSASDNVGVTKVELYRDGMFRGTDTTSPYNFQLDTTAAPNGTYILTAKAYDAAGNVATSSEVQITVNNLSTPIPLPTQAPTVTPIPTVAPTVAPTIVPTIAPTQSPRPTSTPVVTFDTTAPSLDITSPLDGALVDRSSKITISANASDNVGVAKVEFRVGGKLVNTDFQAPYSYQYQLSGKRNNVYTITVTAFDAANNVSSDIVTILSK